jgi:Zn-dependent peptidase ImmA (M78 family)/DNA-binding XRE family transcriptional regulator
VAFQPARLTFARKRRQISKTELAATAKLVPKTLQRYERGEESPKEETLARIANALGFPPEFFVDERPLADIPARSISFRAYSKIKAKLRENAVAVAQLAVEIEAALAEQFELPEPDLPDLREEASDPCEAARLLRVEWELGTGPISNMVHLLERRGARVFSLSEDAADVDAFCFWQDAKAFVTVNRAKSPERGRFDCAHELAHLVLHRKIDFRSKDVEREADAFAGEFLVPSNALAAQAPPFISKETVIKLKRFWGVSAMAMVRRLKEVGRLTDWTYRSMCIDLAKEGYRAGEKHGLQHQETSSLLANMINAGDGVSVRELARELRVPTSDITPLVFDLPRGHLRLVPSRTGPD